MSGALVVAQARAWIGTPYLHQASVKGVGCDCLGLLRGIWRELKGAEPCAMPPYTPDWSEAAGREDLLAAALQYLTPVAMEAAEELGEVLLFRMRSGVVAKHIGLRSSCWPQRKFIHAYSGHAVMENSLSAPWQRRIVARFRLI